MNIRVRDERETSIDRAADRLGYVVVSYGLLAIVIYRSLRGESAWDLLALAVFGGVMTTGYRMRHRVAGRRWAVLLGLTAVVSLVVAAAVTAAIVLLRH